jgi:hypothetical protein
MPAASASLNYKLSLTEIAYMFTKQEAAVSSVTGSAVYAVSQQAPITRYK